MQFLYVMVLFMLSRGVRVIFFFHGGTLQKVFEKRCFIRCQLIGLQDFLLQMYVSLATLK